MPDITLDIIALDGVDNALLVYSTSKCKHIVILEGTERDTSSGDSHISEDLPLVLLTVVLLTVAEDLVVDEGSNHVQEALDSTD